MIGSGFAAQQLVKSLRKLDAEQPIRLITADSGDEYNKPDLSHVVSRGCAAAAMTRQSGSDFAEQQRIALLPLPGTWHRPCPAVGADRAGQLPLWPAGAGHRCQRGTPRAAGQRASGHPQQPAGVCRRRGAIQQARRILVLGAGLIGCELAMDMASDGREVTLLDLADSPLSALLPATLTQPLQQALRSRGSACSAGQVSPG